MAGLVETTALRKLNDINYIRYVLYLIINNASMHVAKLKVFFKVCFYI